ncbi:unnamed protein product [Boreogadus saida]
MSRKKLAWANKEVETFVCILGEEDVVYDVYVDAAAIDIRPTTKGDNLSWHTEIESHRGRKEKLWEFRRQRKGDDMDTYEEMEKIDERSKR